MAKKPRSAGFSSSNNASSSEKARHVLIPKSPSAPFLQLPRELRDKVYRYCHLCLADSTVHLNVEVDRCIYKHYKDEHRAWKFAYPGVHFSLRRCTTTTTTGSKELVVLDDDQQADLRGNVRYAGGSEIYHPSG